MSNYLKKAEEVRNSTERHYNCAQAVLAAFADVCGIDEETAMKMGAHFGSGMRMGSVCGAVTGALMVLGLSGLDEGAAAQTVYRAFKDRHDGNLNCRDLLAGSAAKGIPRKEHCDGLVYEAVSLVESLLKERGV